MCTAPATAFVDESMRPGRYIVACVLIEGTDLGETRRLLRSLTRGGSRLHFMSESPQRRKELLVAFAALSVSVLGWTARLGHGVREFEARERCLIRLIGELQRRSVDQLVIESRERQDADDEVIIHRHRRREPTLVFEHKRAVSEPALWIADGAAWALGAGPVWSVLLGDALEFHRVIYP